MRRTVVAIAVTVGALSVVSWAPSADGTTAVQPRAGFGSNWTVYHQDALGSGVDPSGTSLSPPTAAWASPTLDGQIYGEPLVYNGLVYVATENDTVYALAANTGAVQWSNHLSTPVPSGDLPCGDISPSVGITSTPVIDPSRNEIFVVADELSGASNASHHLMGLDLSTGATLLDTVVDPAGSTPLAQLQRAGLALDAGRVLVGFGGNDGDCGSYHGWLVGVPEGGGAQSTFEVAAASGDSQGAIWMGGAAPVVDGSNNIWLATGNSAFHSSSDSYDDSDGVIELSSGLAVEQYFAPSSWYSDNGSDLDLGSSSPALMGNGLLLQIGKSHIAYVVSQASPGGVGGQAASQGSYCSSDVAGGSAVSGDVVYSPCLSGVVMSTVTPGSPPTLSRGWQTSTGSGGAPIVAGGLVWTIDHNNGMLYGLDPSTGSATYVLSIGAVANHFPTPTVADGLLLAASSTQVHAFAGPGGTPPPPPPPPVATPVPPVWGSVASYVVGQPDGQPSVFVEGAGGSLWNYWYANGTWLSSELTGGGLASGPVVMLQQDGAPSVFFAGAGGSLWNYWYVNGTWDTAEIAAGGVSSGPVVVPQTNGAPSVFVEGPGNSLLNYWYIPSSGIWGSGTSGPRGSTFSAPAVLTQADADGAPSVFVQGPGNSLLNFWYIPNLGTWGSATSAPQGSVYSSPAVLPQPGAGEAPSVLVEGPGNSLLNFWYVPAGGGWGAATSAPRGSVFSSPAVLPQPGAGDSPSVFVQGPGNSLLNFWYVPAGGYWGAGTVAPQGSAAGTPGATTQPDGAPSVFFPGPAASLWNYWYVNGAWDGAEPSLP